jgi:acyl dehydratase
VSAVAGTYFEDVTVGDEEETPALTLTQAHVTLYGGLTGDTLDDPGAIPPLLPLCMSTGLGWRMARPPLVVMAFMGFEWTIHRPLRVGDTVHSRSRAAVKRSMRDGGVVVEEHAIVDQRGVVVQSGRFTFLVAKRAAARPAALTPTG